MIQLTQLTLYRGQRTLLENANLTLHGKHKIGIIGHNGCGKSSFFQMLRGELAPHGGEVQMTKGLRRASLAQHLPQSDELALDYVMGGDDEWVAIQTALKKAEAAEDYDKVCRLHTQLEDIDGYTIESRAAKVMTGLGFTEEDYIKSVAEFSGGWQVRLNLARILLARADQLLLDEPTNHLDLTAIVWLEKWLQSYNGSLLLISHDRDFLDNVVEQIVHFHQKNMTLFKGNYSSFEKQWAEQLLLQQKQYEKQQAKAEHLMKFVNRFRAKASKAKQAQSRLKAIEKLPQIQAVASTSEFQFEFFKPKEFPNPLMRFEQATVGYDEKPMFTGLNLQLVKGQRLGILGPNGEGKTTLIKALAGELPLLKGERVVSSKLPIGYYSQKQFEYLTPDNSAFQHMCDIAPKETQQAMRNYLGRFGFSHDLAMQPIKFASGGERARLVLAMLIWHRPALLLLDEPTNHLDLEMRSALMLALQDFEGSVVLISHDRHLLRSTVDEYLLVADGKVKDFVGDLDDYKTWLRQWAG